MPFATSIQALLGANTPDNTGNVQCAPDWTNMLDYIYGAHPTLGPLHPYLAVQNMNTGAEVNAAAGSTFIGGHASLEYPVGRDTSGNVYVTGGGAGFISQINSGTLAEIQNGLTPFNIQQGCISGIQATDGTVWILISGLGGQVGFEKHSCLKASDLSAWMPGSISWGNLKGLCCAGVPGAGIGWEIVGPQGSGDTQVLDIHKVNVNTGVQADTIVGHRHPTDIDAGWTEIYCRGLCIDQADGNILVALQGQLAATNSNYLAKLSAVNAAIIWSTQMPNDAGGPEGGRMMQYSVVANSRFNFITNQGGGGGIEQTFVNTSTGAIVDQYTTGLSNVLMLTGGAASNDNLGTVLILCQLSAGAGGPSLRNSTPSSFSSAWALLYVEPAPSPPASTTRRFLAEAGPIRVIA